MGLLIDTFKDMGNNRPLLFKAGAWALFHYLLFATLGSMAISSGLFLPYSLATAFMTSLLMNADYELLWLGGGLVLLWMLLFYLPLFFFVSMLTRLACGSGFSPYRLPILDLIKLGILETGLFCILVLPVMLALSGDPTLGLIWSLLVLFLSMPFALHVSLLLIPTLTVHQQISVWGWWPYLRSMKQAAPQVVTRFFVLTALFSAITAFLSGALFYSLYIEQPVAVLFFSFVTGPWMVFAIPVLGFAGLRVHQTLAQTAIQDHSQSYLLPLGCLAALGLLLHMGMGQYNGGQLEQLTIEVQQRIQRQRQRQAFQRPVLRGQPLSGNGADAYWKIIGRHKTEIPGESRRNYEMPTTDQDALREFDDPKHLYQPLRTLNHKYAPLLKQLQRASQYSQIGFQVEFSIAGLIPDLILCQDLTRLLLSTAITDCQDQQCMKGLQHLMDALRFNQDVSHQGLLLPYMVAIANQNKAVKALGPYIKQQSFSEADWKTLLSEFQSVLRAEEGHFQQVMHNEFVALQHTAILMNQPDIFLQEIATGEEDKWLEKTLSHRLKQHLLTPQIVAAIRQLMVFERQFEHLLQRPYAQTKAQRQSLEQKLEQAEQQGNPVFLSLLPALNGPYERSVKTQALLQGLYLLMALQAWFEQQGHYPEQLEQLRSLGLPTLPHDPYSNQPYRYQRLTHQSYRLYSVGENGADDGGKGHYQAPCTTSDIVFTFEPLPKQLCPS